VELNRYTNDLLDDDMFTTDVLTTESLKQLAKELALNLKIKKDLKTNRNLLSDVKKISNELLEGYLLLIQNIEKQNITPATEWFLDNFHIIEEQSRTIKRDLPKGF
jgi:cyclic beta-1,2-glucan synthetase